MAPSGIHGTTVVFVAAVLSCGCATTMQPSRPRPVEVWGGGDDGLTLRFSDAVERALTGSPAFFAGHDKQPRTLVVTIPTNLRWEDVGARTRVFYEVVFADREARRVGTTKGTCWEEQFDACAARIRSYAEKIAGRMQ